MYDALVARAVALELETKLAGGRVQQVYELDALTVGFEVYAAHARHYLLASADPAASRMYEVTTKLRASGRPPSPFMLLLHKHAVGALVNDVAAVPRERIIRVEFDHAEQGVSTLVVELMGRLANIILVDAGGMVLDALRRVPPTKSRARPLLPREPYLVPPPQSKLDPLSLSGEMLGKSLSEAADEPLWQTLVRTVAGTSPLLARELAFRVGGGVDARADPGLAGPLSTALREVWSQAPEPTLALEGERPLEVAAFALTHLGQIEHFASISEALERFYGPVDSYDAVKAPLREALEAARAKLERRRGALLNELPSPEQIDRLRTSGELVLAYQFEISPGQKSLRADGPEGSTSIALDPALTPVENAQKYFAEYRRAQEAAAAVPARLAETEAELAFADQVLDDLERSETRSEIEAALVEAREAGLLPPARVPRPTALPSEPRVYESPDGFKVLVGRNARQNEAITFQRAGPDDPWLHARGVPGSHVVVLAGEREVPESTIEFAAALAAYYSGARDSTRVDVIVAPRKNVRRLAGRATRPGLVTVRGERTVRVRPAAPER